MPKIQKKTLLPIDELNRFESYVTSISYKDDSGRTRYTEDADDIIDELLDILLLAIANGQISANDDLDTETTLPIEVIESITNRKVGSPVPLETLETLETETGYRPSSQFGENWRDTINRHVREGDPPETINRVAETETIGEFNAAADETAKRTGKNYDKQWIAIMDEKTRDTHVVLNGTVVGADERFYSISGDSARYPGDFETAEENCNCRCGIRYIKK